MSSILKVDSIENTSGGGPVVKAYAFRATLHRAVDWTTGGGTGNAVVFDNHSTNGAFNSGFNLSNLATTGLVYFPVNGIYRISASFLTNTTNSAGSTYMCVCKNVTDASNGQPANVLQNDYTYNVANTHNLVTLNTICEGLTTDYFCIVKQDTMKYWSNGTNQASANWGYNQLTCELIGSAQ